MFGLGTVGQRCVDRKPENHTVDIKADKILMTAPTKLIMAYKCMQANIQELLKKHTGDGVGPQ